MNWYFAWGWIAAVPFGLLIGNVIGAILVGDYTLPRIPIISRMFEGMRDGLVWIGQCPFKLIDRVRNK